MTPRYPIFPDQLAAEVVATVALTNAPPVKCGQCGDHRAGNEDCGCETVAVLKEAVLGLPNARTTTEFARCRSALAELCRRAGSKQDARRPAAPPSQLRDAWNATVLHAHRHHHLSGSQVDDVLNHFAQGLGYDSIAEIPLAAARSSGSAPE